MQAEYADAFKWYMYLCEEGVWYAQDVNNDDNWWLGVMTVQGIF